MCVYLILTDLEIQFNSYSPDFQALPFRCDLSHNLWEMRVSGGLKKISVGGETAALILKKKMGECAWGFSSPGFLKENGGWGRGWGDKNGAGQILAWYLAKRSLVVSNRPILSIVQEGNILGGQWVALGIIREGREEALGSGGSQDKTSND